MQRILVSQINEKELARLSRVTRWRAKKRGWIRAIRPEPKPFNYDLAQFESEYKTAISKCFWFDYPVWISREDMKQEAFLQILKLSGDERIHKPGFRVAVMRRRFADLSKKRREDDSYEIQHNLSLWQ